MYVQDTRYVLIASACSFGVFVSVFFVHSPKQPLSPEKLFPKRKRRTSSPRNDASLLIPPCSSMTHDVRVTVPSVAYLQTSSPTKFQRGRRTRIQSRRLDNSQKFRCNFAGPGRPAPLMCACAVNVRLSFFSHA